MFGFLFFPLRLLTMVAAGFVLSVVVKLGSNLVDMMSGRSDLSWPRKTGANHAEDEDVPLWKRRFSKVSDDR